MKLQSGRPQLFWDDSLLLEASYVQRVWHSPKKYPDPVLVAEHPWEMPCPVLYGTVLLHGGVFRMWYACWTRHIQPRIAYAESEDGLVWRKPLLDLCPAGESKRTNVVIQSLAEDGLIDDISVIHDDQDAEFPFKALFWDSDRGSGTDGRGGIHAARSRDGMVWDRTPGRILDWGDRFNAAPCRVNGKFLVFGRAQWPYRRGRAVWRAESEDLLHWSEPELVIERDTEDPPNMQHYSLVAFPYSDLLLGAIERFHCTPDVLDLELVFSRDHGRAWQRTRERRPFLGPGVPPRWDDTWVNLPTNGCIAAGGQLFFFYSGRSGAHGAPFPNNHGAIGLATLREDGFVSLQAAGTPGEVITRPLIWPGGELKVHFDARRSPADFPLRGAGELQVELRDASGATIPGFSAQECAGPGGSSLHAGTVRWQGERGAESLAGREIQLVFRWTVGNLFSFHAAPRA